MDTIILATGFRVTDMPAADLIRGADGRALADVLAGQPAGIPGHQRRRVS
ncbi:MAG TPA: hypothetical protein VIS06_11010 [Mycobacteriales bacterium]